MRDILITGAATGTSDKVVLRTNLDSNSGNFTVMWTDGINDSNRDVFDFRQGKIFSTGEVATFIAENNLQAVVGDPGDQETIEPATPYLTNAKILFIVDEESYNKNLPKHYTDRYPWALDPNIPNDLPWIILYWDKTVLNSEMEITMKKDGTDVEFTDISDRLTTVSGDGKTITTSLPADVFWDIRSQLQIAAGSESGEYEVTFKLGEQEKTIKEQLNWA